MSLQQLEQPPPYNHTTQSLDLPAVPRDELSQPRNLPHLPPMEPSPSLSYNPMNSTSHHASPSNGHIEGRITLQPLRLPNVPSHSPGITAPSGYALEQTLSNKSSSYSIGDADERIAAEALLGIGQTGMKSSRSSSSEERKSSSRHQKVPSGYETPLKYFPIDIAHKETGSSQDRPSEPLLSLLTSSHPWLGGTVNGSINAYSATKSYSPRFIQSGADLVESTLGAVGRRTGVEDGIRRYLDSRRPVDVERANQDETGRISEWSAREQSTDDEHERNGISRQVSGASVDTLPAYDDNKSPSYEEAAKQTRLAIRPNINRSWSAQLMITTSGLGAALNEASLRSLKFCLDLLHRANSHIRGLMERLRELLQEYSQGRSVALGDDADKEDAVMTDGEPAQQTAPSIADRIKQLNNEIWNTFKEVVNSVSRYTGGALPENASMVVRWQLMSVPRRWQHVVTNSRPVHDESVSSANRMLAFAIEGLDMMDQVSGVVDSTIMSAERWLESMGRRRGNGSDRQPQALPEKEAEQYRD